MIYQDLKDISKIDSFSFMQHNRRIDNLFPELPIYTITHPSKTIKQDKTRIDKIIKEFISKQKKAGV